MPNTIKVQITPRSTDTTFVFDNPFNGLSTAKLKLLEDTTANICICQHEGRRFLTTQSFKKDYTTICFP